eukprot:2799842-Rhodomonas_salina.2
MARGVRMPIIKVLYLNRVTVVRKKGKVVRNQVKTPKSETGNAIFSAIWTRNADSCVWFRPGLSN